MGPSHLGGYSGQVVSETTPAGSSQGSRFLGTPKRLSLSAPFPSPGRRADCQVGGRDFPAETKAAATAGAPHHPHQGGHFHRPSCLLQHHPLPEPPAFSRPPSRPPLRAELRAAPLHPAPHSQPRSGRLRPLLQCHHINQQHPGPSSHHAKECPPNPAPF